MSELRDDRQKLYDEDRFGVINKDLFKVGDLVTVVKDQVDLVGIIISIDNITVVINHKWDQCCAKVWEITKL